MNRGVHIEAAVVAEVAGEVAVEDPTTKPGDLTTKAEIKKTVTHKSENENGALPRQRATGGPLIRAKLGNIAIVTEVCTIFTWEVILLVQLI